MKYIVIDNRMREVEKDFLESLGYKLIELEKSENVYPEISSHVDIFVAKVDDVLIVEKSRYKQIRGAIKNPSVQIIERGKFCM